MAIRYLRRHHLFERAAREIGIRIALGASRSSIVRLVMGQGMCFILVGLVSGIAMAVGLTRLPSTVLFGLAATDAVTLARSPWSSQRFRHSPAPYRRRALADWLSAF